MDWSIFGSKSYHSSGAFSSEFDAHQKRYSSRKLAQIQYKRYTRTSNVRHDPTNKSVSVLSATTLSPPFSPFCGRIERLKESASQPQGTTITQRWAVPSSELCPALWLSICWIHNIPLCSLAPLFIFNPLTCSGTHGISDLQSKGFFLCACMQWM